MRVLATFLGLLSMAGGAWAQSLLGESDASPYDPPPRPAFKRHDLLRIVVRKPAPVQAEGTTAARTRVRRATEPPAEASFTLAAEVVDVRPNGTLVVQAMKRRRIGGDEEVIRLTGEVAAAAVSDGSVGLEEMHNLSLAYDGPGRTSHLGNAGFMSGLLGRVWPF